MRVLGSIRNEAAVIALELRRESIDEINSSRLDIIRKCIIIVII